MHVLEIQLRLEGTHLDVSARERLSNGSLPPLLLHERVPFETSTLHPLSQELTQCLAEQREPTIQREQMTRLGQRLFDLLLGQRLKAKLRASVATHLVLELPESLLSLPWELLHDGSNFLCLKFAMGRLVMLEQSLQSLHPRVQQAPYGLLLICDPRGDLPHAAQEGQRLRKVLRPRRNQLQVALDGAGTEHQKVLSELYAYPLVHFAGHAVEADALGPPGWLLDDGRLTPHDIQPMQGAPNVPALIFANACFSAAAATELCLPTAFLGVGVRHYLGTISELPDQDAGTVAEHFYLGLLAGQSVGASVRRARVLLAQQPQLPAQSWATYVLYGDPGTAYFEEPPVSAQASLASVSDVASSTGVETAQSSPALPVPALPESSPATLPEPSVSLRARLRLYGAGLLATLLTVFWSLLALLGLLEPLELVWERLHYFFVDTPRPFQTEIVLLGLESNAQQQVENRRLYAELLERLVQAGASPSVVAFDTWLTASSRTEHDTRLMHAVAQAVREFPVLFGLERESSSGVLLPLPGWFQAGVHASLMSWTETECAQRVLKLPPPRPVDGMPLECEPFLAEPVKVCACERALIKMRRSLLTGDVYIKRPVGALEYLGLRMPVLQEGARGFLLQSPHFAVQLADPARWSLDVGQQGVRSSRMQELTRYNRRGMVPVIFRARASWGIESHFPAERLRQTLARWRGEPETLPEGQVPVLPTPQSVQGVRLLVGIGHPETLGNEQDLYNTPLGRMFGVEVLANMAEALASGQAPRQVPELMSLSFTLLLGGLGFWSGRRGLGWLKLSGMLMAVLGLSYVLLLGLRWYLPPVAGALALLCVVPLGRLSRTPSRP